ncbi:MAG: ABC transporter permease subunit [Actinomycetota bacterium]
MTITSRGRSSPENISQIKTQRLFLAILLKERVRLFILLGYFFIHSFIIYVLSNNVLDKNSPGIYSNPTIVLYFRILVLANPLIVALLFGVPLLSTEYETGTYRFLFTHGIGRKRLVRAYLTVYAISTLLCSVMTFISINHFFAVQTEAGPISIWSFAVFACRPIIIIALTLTLFMAGVFLGALMQRIILGTATTILFSILLILGIQVSLEKVLFLFVQRLKTYNGNPTDAYNNFVGSHDSTYMFHFQISYAFLLIILSLLLAFGSQQAIRNGGILYRKSKQPKRDGSKI